MSEEVKTTPEFWDCDCNKEYIHPKTVGKCEKCGCHNDYERPDSRVDELYKIDNMNLNDVNNKLFIFFKTGVNARAEMFNGDRMEAMRLYKSLSKEMRDLAGVLRRLVF